MSYTNSYGRLRHRTRAKEEAAMSKIDTRTIMKEQAVIKQDIMVAPFDFINDIF
jgi:hypothetical protein